jgi:hypothetical protein
MFLILCAIGRNIPFLRVASASGAEEKQSSDFRLVSKIYRSCQGLEHYPLVTTFTPRGGQDRLR